MVAEGLAEGLRRTPPLPSRVRDEPVTAIGSRQRAGGKEGRTDLWTRNTTYRRRYRLRAYDSYETYS